MRVLESGFGFYVIFVIFAGDESQDFRDWLCVQDYVGDGPLSVLWINMICVAETSLRGSRDWPPSINEMWQRRAFGALGTGH